MPKLSLDELRRQQLQVLLAEHRGNATDLARTLRRPPAQVSHWLHGHKNISEKSARDIELRAKKAKHWLDGETAPKATGAEEPQATYDIATSWPLGDITPHQYRRLSPSQQALVEGHIKLLLQVSADSDAPSWRDAALAVAVAQDTKASNNLYTKFVAVVDEHFERHTKAKAPVSRTKAQRTQ